MAVTGKQESGSSVNEEAQAPERFDPTVMHGSLLEAEHLARYWWATGFVSGKRVLDAGCGTGYGTRVLAGAGAVDVVGVDIDAAVMEEAREQGSEGVSFEVADARELPFTEDAFDVVVCFEVIEHVEDPESILDELRRVLGADGLLVVSSPNRSVYPPGNPHHKHEFLPEELADALQSRFTHVRLVRQHDWLGSGVLEDEGFASTAEPFDSIVRKAVAMAPGNELYTLALAGDTELPSAKPCVVLTSTADAKWWQEKLAELEQRVSALLHAHEALTRRVFVERVQRAELDTKLTQVQAEKLELDARLAHAEAENAELNSVIRSMQSTRVWRLASSYWKRRDSLLRRREPAG